MKNGDRISGEVKQIWNGEVFIEPEYGDEYAVEMEYVAYVETAEPFEVDIRIGQRIEPVVGRLGRSEDGKAAVLDESGKPVYPQSMIDNVLEIDDFFDWGFRTDFSVNVSEGNTETSSSRLNVFGDLTVGKHFHELLLSRDEQRVNNNLEKDQSQVAYRDTWTYSDRWFVRGGASWTRDPIRDLDQRTRVFVGPGYHIFDDSKRRLNVSLGPELFNEEIAGVTERSRGIKVMLDYQQLFMKDDLVVYYSTDFTRVYDGRRNKIFEIDLGFRFDVTDDIYVNLSGTYDYESNPAEGQKNEDITYLVGVGIELD
jgi:putative salt-induced outer membrane protein YdiY